MVLGNRKACNFARAGRTLFGTFYYLGSTSTTWNFLMRVLRRTLRQRLFFFSFLTLSAVPKNLTPRKFTCTWHNYHFFTEKIPLSYYIHFFWQIVSLSHTLSIISNGFKCTHFKIWISHETRTFFPLFHRHKMLLSALLTSTGKNRTISTHERKSGFRNAGKFCLWNPDYSSRNPESLERLKS